MIIKTYIPSSPLNTFIKVMWISEGVAQTKRIKILPDTSLHLMINLGEPYRIYKTDTVECITTCKESWCVGIWKNSHLMDYPTKMHILNITFLPGGAFPFIGYPAIEVENNIVPLEAIWGSKALELREKLYYARSADERFKILEVSLFQRLKNTEISKELIMIQDVIRQISVNNGVLSISSLSELYNISQKHLIHLFLKFVGATPKEVAKIFRFNFILSQINSNSDINWTNISQDSGYYDQSHFNKDFKSFTQMTPSEYLKETILANGRVPELSSSPNNLATG